MIAKLKSWWLWFWCQHVQKTMAALLGGGIVYDEIADLYTEVVSYAPDLNEILGHALYRRVRLIMVVLILLRAVLKPRKKE